MKSTHILFITCIIVLIAMWPLVTKDGSINTLNQGQTNSGQKIKLLIVPGHEPNDGGAIYLDRKERDMVLILSRELQQLFATDKRFEVMVARDESGFTPTFQSYFDANADTIKLWQAQKKKETVELITSGTLKEIKEIEHNRASDVAALHLYGINKWLNDQRYDLVVHLHINDDNRKKRKTPGKYKGFSIYIPEKQFTASAKSRMVAESIKKELEQHFATSTLASEKGTVLESQKLIATGRYQTLDIPSVLIEYGYIYEPHFERGAFEQGVAQQMAEDTYRGITNVLFP